MSKSKASRAKEAACVLRQLPRKHQSLSDDITITIAHIVRTFEFTGSDGGNCLARAVIGHATLRACGLRAKLVAGGLLYRAGPDPQRDTLRFCLSDGRGGFHDDGYLVP
jgi:hypothetical protein